MTSIRKIEANKNNASRSTGPREANCARVKTRAGMALQYELKTIREQRPGSSV